jgi:dTDP-4-amino-4,6-dideoxygalactose transaminase
MYNFKIIEDAAHAIGSSYQDFKTGGCQFSDITTFSFHPVKIVTTAEGGMAVTNNKDLAHKMRLLRSHGVTRDESEMVKEPVGDWYYEQIMLGFNYRMTELQAALGLSQMSRLDEFVAQRNALAENYNNLLASLPIEIPSIASSRESSFHLYVIRLKLDEITLSHSDVFSKLRSAGIGVNLHYMPVYLQPYYQKLAFSGGKFIKGYCLEAESYAGDAISIPLYPSLTSENQVRIADELKGLLCQ